RAGPAHEHVLVPPAARLRRAVRRPPTAPLHVPARVDPAVAPSRRVGQPRGDAARAALRAGQHAPRGRAPRRRRPRDRPARGRLAAVRALPGEPELRRAGREPARRAALERAPTEEKPRECGAFPRRTTRSPLSLRWGTGSARTRS